MTCKRIEMPWEEKLHGIFFHLKTDPDWNPDNPDPSVKFLSFG